MEETIVISLGGSLIVPEEVDIEFLKSFKTLILNHVAQGKRFVIDTGGGRTCRKYQAAAKDISSPSNIDLDWVGIMANNLNAELLRVIFDKDAHNKVIYNLSEKFSLEKPIVVGCCFGS